MDLVIIITISITVTAYIVNATKGVCYFAPNKLTDNEKIVRSANEISLLDWPSKMHQIDYNRSQLREYWTLSIRIVQKITGNVSDWNNITLAIVCNAFSTILIYLVLEIEFDRLIAFGISLIYLTSIWPYHVALYMGHVHLAQCAFIISIYLLQYGIYNHSTLSFLSSGIMISFSFFSSSASRKYPPMYILLFFLLTWDKFQVKWNLSNGTIVIIIVAICTFFLLISKFKEDFLKFIAKIIEEKHTDKIEKPIRKVIIITMISIIFFAGINYDVEYSYEILLIIIGIIIVSMHIFLPPKEFIANLKRYYVWLNVSEWASHFNSYPDPLQTFGVKIPKNFKGGGLLWIQKLFMKMCPYTYVLWVSSMIILLINLEGNLKLTEIIGLGLISITPVIIHLITGGLRVGKAFFSEQIFMYLPIALVCTIEPVFTYLLIIISVIQGFKTLEIMKKEIIKCRMGPTLLYCELKKRNIVEFYTYETAFNHGYVETMLYQYPNQFKVKYIKRMEDITTGYFVVPPTSSKSVLMETQTEAILYGDFDKDIALETLFRDKMIEREAIAKIPTLGTSRYYAQESEVTSYRDLILGQITEYDHWRGNGWLIYLEGKSQ